MVGASRYAPADPTLPQPWRGLIDGNNGNLFYWNPTTNITQYDRPLPPPQAMSGTRNGGFSATNCALGSCAMGTAGLAGGQRSSGSGASDDPNGDGSPPPTLLATESIDRTPLSKTVLPRRLECETSYTHFCFCMASMRSHSPLKSSPVAVVEHHFPGNVKISITTIALW